jgi:hypothetical protein
MQIDFERFRDLALGELRRSASRTCIPDGPRWFEDLWRDEGRFALFRTPPVIPGIVEQIDPDAARDFFLDLARLDAPPFLRSLNLALGPTNFRIRPGADDEPVTIAYDVGLSPAPAPDDFVRFNQDIRNSGVFTRQWAIAISGEAMQVVVSRVATAIGTSTTATTSFGPVSILATSIDVAQWGDPITFAGVAQATFNGNDVVEIEFEAMTRFMIDTEGELTLDFGGSDNRDISTRATSFWDRLLDYGPGKRRGAAEALREALLNAFHAQFDRFVPSSIEEICQVVTGTGHGSIAADEVIQQADRLVFFGRVSALVPGRPRLAVTDDGNRKLELGAPYQDLPTSVLLFEESVESVCGGGGQDTLFRSVTLGNEGAGFLFICDVGVLDQDGEFEALLPRSVPFSLQPGETEQITLRYTGGRRRAFGTLAIDCNEPDPLLPHGLGPSRTRRFLDLQSRAGSTAYRVDPPAVEIRVANTMTGTPRSRLGPGCRPVVLRDTAGSFRIHNTGDNLLYLCGANADPTGIFVVPFVQARIRPGESREIGILFFPDAALVRYTFDLVISSSEGDILVPIDGEVEALPQVGEFGDWVDLATDTLCVPPDVLCRSMAVFGALPEPSLAIMRLAFDGVPGDTAVDIATRDGATIVTDHSPDPWRAHELIFGTTPDGIPRSGDPCEIRVRGPDPRPGLVRVDVTGNVIRPLGEWQPDDDIGAAVPIDGWLYASSGEGLLVADWREGGRPSPAARLDIGTVRAITGDGQRLAVATGKDVLAFGLEDPGRPKEIASAPLEGATAAAISGDRVLVGTGDAVRILALEFGRFVEESRIELPQSATWLGPVGPFFFAAGQRCVSLLRVDPRGKHALLGAVALDRPATHVFAFRRDILSSDDAGTALLRIDRTGEVRGAARYHQPHWSAAYAPDAKRLRLVQRTDGSFRLWGVAPRRLDKAKFPKALELLYRPVRPKSDARAKGTLNRLDKGAR